MLLEGIKWHYPQKNTVRVFSGAPSISHSQQSPPSAGLPHDREMASSMSSSPWNLSSAAKLKQFSIGLTSSGRNPSTVRSFSDKNFLCNPALLSYGSWESNNEVRWRRIAATDDTGSTSAEVNSSESVPTEKTTNQLLVKGMEAKPVLKRTPLTAREKLRAARVLSKYAESKPAKLAMGSTVLDALRETDKGKRRPGLPEAPMNMFDDRKRGLPKEGWKFQLPGGNDLFFIAFSFVFISTIMFGTTYVVWKAGAIHFNEF